MNLRLTGREMRTVLALMLREISTSHGRLPGGYLWSVAEPVAGIVLLAAILTHLVPSPPLGRSFVLFYATAYLPFVATLDIAGRVGGAIRFSRPLFGYPALRWPAALAARFLLAALQHVALFWVMVPIIAIWAGEPLPVDPLMVTGGLAGMAVLGLGWGALNAYLFEAAPLWERAWGVLTRPLILLSGLTFLPEKLPTPLATVLVWDPLTHGLGIVRAGVYAGYSSPIDSLGFLLAAGLMPLVVGLWLLRRGAARLIAEL